MFKDPVYAALCSAVTLQSNKNGFFQHFADNVVNAVDDSWLTNFGKLKTNKERIVKCLTDKRIKEQVLQTLENVQEIYRAKSSLISKERRQEADHLFRTGKLEKSLLMYTRCIIRAPTASAAGNDLALALWGRSAIHYELKKFQFCLDDVKLCLKEKLPDNLKFEAYWRMAECYVNLHQFDLARISLNVLQRLTIDDETKQWQDKISSKLNEIARHSEARNSNSNNSSGIADDQFERLTGGEHPKLIGASKKLKISYAEKAGKHFVARERINTGDTLVAENPYVCCLDSEKYGSHCQRCLRRLETAIPCTDCSAIAFCSLNCRTHALETFHKFECRYLDLLIGSGMSILCFAALRIVTQQNVKYFIEAKLDDVDGENNSHPYKEVYNMVSHDDKRTPVDFLRRTLMALFLLAVLKKTGYFLNLKGVDNINSQELSIAQVLLRNLEVLQFNAHEIYETVQCKNTSKILKPLKIGIGLYRTAAYFNHDCYPAVTRLFVGTKLVIKAIKSTIKNEIVGDDYGPIFTKCNLTDRQKKLSSRYWFNCECKACREKWPLMDNLVDKFFKIKCSFCQKIIIIEEKQSEQKCKNCSLSIDVNAVLKKVNVLKQLHLQILQREKLNIEHITTLCTLFDTFSEIVYPPNKTSEEIRQKLIQYWMSCKYVHSVS